jgi:hypothetical protein
MIPFINVLALVIYSKSTVSSSSALTASTLLLIPDLVATLLANPAAAFVEWYGRRVRLLIVCGASLALLYAGFWMSTSTIEGHIALISLWLVCIGIIYALFSSVSLCVFLKKKVC